MIKFNKNIKDFNYVLSFDLAKHNTGYSLLDISNNRIILTGMIVGDETKENFWYGLYEEFEHLLLELSSKFDRKKIFIVKEKLPTQNGRFSTISTLQALAQVHAILDVVCGNCNYEVYDYDGVHSVSVKTYFKEITEIEKPTKEDIANKISLLYPTYDFKNAQLDITDSLAVSITLINKKWDKDITEEIKRINKEIKKYKSEKKKQELLLYIDKLNKLKINKKEGE